MHLIAIFSVDRFPPVSKVGTGCLQFVRYGPFSHVALSHMMSWRVIARDDGEGDDAIEAVKTILWTA